MTNPNPTEAREAIHTSDDALVVYAASILDQAVAVREVNGEIAGVVYYNSERERWYSAGIDDCNVLLQRVVGGLEQPPFTQWCEDTDADGLDSRREAERELVDPPPYVWTITIKVTATSEPVADGFNPTDPEAKRDAMETLHHITSNLEWWANDISAEIVKVESPDLARILDEQGYSPEKIAAVQALAAEADLERRYQEARAADEPDDRDPFSDVDE